MARIALFDFQQKAADRLVASALDYFRVGPDRIAGRNVPFVGQLKAVTGAGKTPILADVVGRLSPAIILWTTKYGSVVDQTVANLRPGGKYFHLLGRGQIEVISFTDIPSAAEWRYILDREDGLTILVSTVAAWNTREKDARLNVHRINADWGDKSRWQQLKTERQRPLWVVYDEAHNTTTEQVELLDDLDPAGFFVASASPLQGKLQQYLSSLNEDMRKQRVAPVSTRDVVDAQLLKSTISLADYDSTPIEMITDVVLRRDDLETRFSEYTPTTTPKAIYVVETSNTAERGVEPRPVAIWKMLVTNCAVAPDTIAICTNTKDLPKDAIRVDSIDNLSNQYKHIIFNKKLQEGWDDPSVYVCYFDGKTDSATRIQQVLGRALRQPNATHLSDEDLNTAYFFINCPNQLFEEITDDLKEQLRIYKGDNELDDFELPFTVKEERKSLPKIALKDEWVNKLKVPKLQLELPKADLLTSKVNRSLMEFGDGDRAAPGRALVNIVSVRTGEVATKSRDLLEDMRVPCGQYLQTQIRTQSRDCANAIHPATFSDEKLNKLACYGSGALEYYRKLAIDIVEEYENHVKLSELADPDEQDYVVGPYEPRGTTPREFENAAHPHYDTKSFNKDELSMARALDKFSDYVWVRNKDRVGYGIPLPQKSVSSSRFYPDFLWWVKDTVWAIDPTGRFLLDEKIRAKLLEVPAPLKIALVTRGKHDNMGRNQSDEGWTLVRRKMGIAPFETFDTLDEILETLVEEA